MAGLDQIKEIVMKNIEDTGYLDQLRAQLKLQVFKIIDNQDEILKNNAGFQWEHPQQTQLKAMVHGLSSLQLVIEYLEFFKLDYTVQVLRKEAKLNEPTIREALASKVGLSGRLDSLKPLLIVLITEYLKNQNISPQTPAQQYTKQESVAQKKPEPIKEQPKTEKIKVEPAKQEQPKNDQKGKEKQLEESKKPQDRPQTAPVKKEEPPTAVNKIRGAKTNMSNINNIYGFDVTGGNKSKTQYDDMISSPTNDPYAFDLGQKKNNADPYAFDIGGGNQKGQKQGQQKNADPYAFDIGSKTQQKTNDPYSFDIGSKKTQNEYDFDLDAPVAQNNKKAGNPYNFKIDEDNNKNKKQDKNQAANKFNSQAYQFDINENKSQKKGNKKEEIEEDIDDFMESRDDKVKQSNNMYTSSEDMMRATQSMGVDESVDSLALEDYDYYEDVTRKR